MTKKDIIKFKCVFEEDMTVPRKHHITIDDYSKVLERGAESRQESRQEKRQESRQEREVSRRRVELIVLFHFIGYKERENALWEQRARATQL